MTDADAPARTVPVAAVAVLAARCLERERECVQLATNLAIAEARAVELGAELERLADEMELLRRVHSGIEQHVTPDQHA